ncbi:hypothetical protein BRPE67_BCDS14800 [Caballeronia cordobensis]|nr:hypothetical protein BRPE67_BCDS14800 [Burkholderia sp. RPE67]
MQASRYLQMTPSRSNAVSRHPTRFAGDLCVSDPRAASLAHDCRVYCARQRQNSGHRCCGRTTAPRKPLCISYGRFAARARVRPSAEPRVTVQGVSSPLSSRARNERRVIGDAKARARFLRSGRATSPRSIPPRASRPRSASAAGGSAARRRAAAHRPDRRVPIGKPCSSATSAAVQSPHTSITLPTLTCAAKGSARVTLSPVSGPLTTRYPASSRVRYSTCVRPAWPGS